VYTKDNKNHLEMLLHRRLLETDMVNIPCELISYDLLQKHPDAEVNLKNDPFVSGLMFWDEGKQKQYGNHLVIITEGKDKELPESQMKNVVFICSSKLKNAVNISGNSFICLSTFPEPEILFNEIQVILEKFQRWYDELESAVTESHSYRALIDACDPILQDPIALVDAQFRYVAYSVKKAVEKGFVARYVGKNEYLPLESINSLTVHPEFQSRLKLHGVFHDTLLEDMLHINLFYQNRYIGRLGLPFTDIKRTNQYYSRILLIMADYTERLYRLLGTFFRIHSADRLREFLLSIADGRKTETGKIRKLLVERGFSEGDKYLVIQFAFTLNHDPEQYKENGMKALSNHMENMWPGATAFLYANTLYVLLDITYYTKATEHVFTQELAVLIRESLLQAGLSRTFSDFSSFEAAIKQTAIALEYGNRFTPTYWYFLFDNYASEYLLEHGYAGFRPSQVIAPEIVALLEYDQEHGTEYNLTLRIFMREQYNAVAAARQLCIARSSFLKRLSRIKALTGIDLHRGRQRAYLILSYGILDQYSLSHAEL
jgi:hypothetical protein